MKIIQARTKTMFLGSNLHVMMQALKGADGPCLPHGLSVMNTYTQDDYQEQGSCSCGEETDCHSYHHCQGCQSHASSSSECGAPGGGCIWNFGEVK